MRKIAVVSIFFWVIFKLAKYGQVNLTKFKELRYWGYVKSTIFATVPSLLDDLINSFAVFFASLDFTEEADNLRFECVSINCRATWTSGTSALCDLISIAFCLSNQFLILANRRLRTLLEWWARSIGLSSKRPVRLCVRKSSSRCVSNKCTLGVANLLKYSRYLTPNHFATFPNCSIVSTLWIVVWFITEHRKSKAWIAKSF